MALQDKGTGQIVSQAELAMIMGVSALTVKAWTDKGMPCLQRANGPGQRAKYNTADCIAWRHEQLSARSDGPPRTVEYDEAKRRKLVAEAESAEIDLKVKQGALVSVDEVGKIVEQEYSTVRANFIAMPGEIAPELEHCTSLEIEERLTLKITEILKALSADELYQGAPDDDDE
jgi:phage terminase Nu1 subunit (DNA packaging protein)